MIIETFVGFLSKIFCFTSYVNNQSSFPRPLTAQEEREWVIKMQAGDGNAREMLIRHNLRLVAHVVKKYSGAGEADDLISVGSIGLIKGIESYQLDKGSLLSTYAAKCIDNEILMYIRANKKHKNNLSLQESVGADKDGNEITLMEVLPDPAPDPFLKIENKATMQKVLAVIRNALDERELKVISMRYGLLGQSVLTQLEIAEKLNISRSYVSRIEKKAIGKIRKAMKLS